MSTLTNNTAMTETVVGILGRAFALLALLAGTVASVLDTLAGDFEVAFEQLADDLNGGDRW